MTLVKFEVHQETLDGDNGPVEGVVVICSKCGHEVEVFGTGENSILRGAATLRAECPLSEQNYYEEA